MSLNSRGRAWKSTAENFPWGKIEYGSIRFQLLRLRFQGKTEILRNVLSRLGGVPGGDGDGEEGLGLADGAGLLELDEVADLELVLGVVRLVRLLLPDPPLVLGVRRQPRHLHRHRLIVDGGDHPALQAPHGPDGEREGRRRPAGRSQGAGLRGGEERGSSRLGAIQEWRSEEFRGGARKLQEGARR